MATNTITDVHYIGWSIGSPLKRWKQHCYSAEIGSQLFFHRALRKYGRDAFIWYEVEEFATADEAQDAEEFWIDYCWEHGIVLYNMTEGGDGAVGRPVSTATRNKIRGALLGKWKHENNPCAKLGWREVMIIRRLLTLGVSVRFCYTHFAVSKPLILGIQHERTWKSDEAPLLSQEQNEALALQINTLFIQFQLEEEEEKKAYKSKYPDWYCQVCGKLLNRQRRKFCSATCTGKGQSTVNWANINLTQILEGRTIAEVAILLECSPTNVRNQMSKLGIVRGRGYKPRRKTSQ